MRLLALDPSLTCTGWATFDAGKLDTFGSIITNKKADTEIRLQEITELLDDVMLGQGLTNAVIEIPAPGIYGRKRKGHDKYVTAVQVCKSVCWQRLGADKVFLVDAPTWKKTAKKQDTIMVVNAEHGLCLKKKDNDIADAIALGDWYLRDLKFRKLKADAGL